MLKVFKVWILICVCGGWWLSPAPIVLIVRGLVPSPMEHRKVTLVDCSCHWVTSLMGRFLRCPIVWTRFVQHLLATEPSSVGRHNRDIACWQAREPREKIGCLLPFGILPVIDKVFILWLVHSSTRRYNHLTYSFTFPQTSYIKLFSVARIESLLCGLSSSSGAL